jgi:hypothetical protein
VPGREKCGIEQRKIRLASYVSNDDVMGKRLLDLFCSQNWNGGVSMHSANQRGHSEARMGLGDNDWVRGRVLGETLGQMKLAELAKHRGANGVQLDEQVQGEERIPK